MILAERSIAPFRLRRGTNSLIVSMPHAGTFVPHAIGRHFRDVGALRPDTDWHMPRLYDFLEPMGATTLVATHSRYVVDVNRPPGGENLYPGRDTPKLCPTDTFDSKPLYRDGGEPSESDIAARVDAVWKPYHRALDREIARVRQLHGVAIVWDAHSIISRAPRLFQGRLSDFNLGTADDASCDPSLSNALLVALKRHPEFTSVLNGRFKGGYITRHYGRPDTNIHAVQLEMAQCLYMDESAPYCFRNDLAECIRPILREQIGIALQWAVNRPRA
jgi:N-formylglutamate deformylase